MTKQEWLRQDVEKLSEVIESLNNKLLIEIKKNDIKKPKTNLDYYTWGLKDAYEVSRNEIIKIKIKLIEIAEQYASMQEQGTCERYKENKTNERN